MSYFDADNEADLKHQFRLILIKHGKDGPDYNPQILEEAYDEYHIKLLKIMRMENYVSPFDFVAYMFEQDAKERNAIRKKRFRDIFRNKDEKLLKRTFHAIKSLFEPVEHMCWVEKAKLHGARQKAAAEAAAAAQIAAEAEAAAQTVPEPGAKAQIAPETEGQTAPAQPDRNELSPDKDTLPSITPTN